MYYQKTTIKDIFALSVTAANTTVKGEFELDKNGKYLIGLSVISDRDAQLYHRGSFKITLNDQEIVPENFQAKMWNCGLNVPANTRPIDVGRIGVGNGRLEVTYKDTNHPEAAFSAYTVFIYAFVNSNDI